MHRKWGQELRRRSRCVWSVVEVDLYGQWWKTDKRQGSNPSLMKEMF